MLDPHTAGAAALPEGCPPPTSFRNPDTPPLNEFDVCREWAWTWLIDTDLPVPEDPPTVPNAVVLTVGYDRARKAFTATLYAEGYGRSAHRRATAVPDAETPWGGPVADPLPSARYARTKLDAHARHVAATFTDRLPEGTLAAILWRTLAAMHAHTRAHAHSDPEADARTDARTERAPTPPAARAPEPRA